MERTEELNKKINDLIDDLDFAAKEVDPHDFGLPYYDRKTLVDVIYDFIENLK